MSKRSPEVVIHPSIGMRRKAVFCLILILFGALLFSHCSSREQGVSYGEISWLPLNKESLERAAEEEKPLLFFIRAFWENSSDVMEEVTFRDPEVVALVMKKFVPVKIDGEREPTINMRFQQEVFSRFGTGGWPLALLVSPEGKVTYGGAPFTRSDFLENFLSALEFSLNEGERNEMGALPDREKAGVGIEKEKKSLPSNLPLEVLLSVRDGLDSLYGGKLGPKFPPVPLLEFLLFMGSMDTEAEDMRFVEKTLKAMGSGAIRDPLWGGFSRISYGEDWNSPSYEKLLEVNAGLANVYLEAHTHLSQGWLQEVAEEIFRFTEETFRDKKTGAFWSSQKAGGTLEEGRGAFYLWDESEIKEVLNGEEGKMVLGFFGLEGESQKKTLGKKPLTASHDSLDELSHGSAWNRKEVEALVERGIQKLRSHRRREGSPPVDRTFFTNKNAQMASSLFKAYGLLKDRNYLEQAEGIVRFLRERCLMKEGVPHFIDPIGGETGRRGILSDYVNLLSAFLSAYEVTGKGDYLSTAEEMGHAILEKLVSRKGEYKDSPPLDLFPKDFWKDRADINLNSFLAENLVKLAWITGKELFSEKGKEILSFFYFEYGIPEILTPSFGLAAAKFFNEPVIVTLGGKEGESFLHQAHSLPLPWKVIKWAEEEGCTVQVGANRASVQKGEGVLEKIRFMRKR